MDSSFLGDLTQALFGGPAPAHSNEKEFATLIETFNQLEAALKSGQKKDTMPKLNNLNSKVLEPVVYLLNNTLSEADLILFDKIAATVKSWNQKETHHFNNISRWYDNIQHNPKLQPVVEKYNNFVVFELDVPKAPSKEQKKQEQQQKTKQGQQQKGQQAKPKAEIPPQEVVISRLEFKVGKIVDVQRHPSAEFLYQETIDFGEEKPRTVVSGLVKYVPIDQMKDRLVICLTNLKPAPLRGVLSEAMVICASHPTDDNLKELIDPPAGSVPGDKVFFEGHAGQPDAPINLSVKGNIFQLLSPELKTNGERVACWKGVPMQTEKGVVTAKSCADSLLG